MSDLLCCLYSGYRMGNINGRHFRSRLSQYTDKLEQTDAGNEIYSCSFEKWTLQYHAALCGFWDSADYCTPRVDSRSKDYILRPDVTEGRYIRIEKISNRKIFVEEKQNSIGFEMRISPCFTSGKKTPTKIGLNFRNQFLHYVQSTTTKDGIEVIGCLGNLAVIQFLDGHHCYVPEFYIIDLEERKCLSKFNTKDAELLWYECYIAPDKTRIILRPDYNMTYSSGCGEIMRIHYHDGFQIITMKKFAENGGYVITFDNRHANRYIFRGKEKQLQLFDLEKMEAVQCVDNLPLKANIHQIKSSRGGYFLAIRCMDHAQSLHHFVNTIAILNAEKFDVLFDIDVKGPFWLSSEMVNLQVFPRFSTCDSAVAVMKNGTSKRKILIYKLPTLNYSLQHLCRRIIRRSVYPSLIHKLPLPAKVIKYLHYQY